MNGGVRIIKRGSVDCQKSLPPSRDEKTTRQSEREMVGTVKSWIAEWEERMRADRRRAFALIK